MGVDVIQFPKSQSGNQYAVVFTDYSTKWPEVFATKDQTALTIAELFVEEIVCRHGVPGQLLSDRGAAFLSRLLKEICSLLGVKKINTTAYHPQTNGLTERFNRTLTDMLAKRVEKNGKDWDTHLPFVLFAYRASTQESTKESPFYLMYGRDPRLPTALEMDNMSCEEMDVDSYKRDRRYRLNYLRHGNWLKIIIRKHRVSRKLYMIARQNHLSLAWETECSYTCRRPKHAKLTSLLDHFTVLTEFLNRMNWEWLFGQ